MATEEPKGFKDFEGQSPRTLLAYAMPAARPLNRWGLASCIRAAISFAISAYAMNARTQPWEGYTAVFCWPLALIFGVIGMSYGFLGTWRDPRRRTALLGLTLNLLIIIMPVLKTWQAGQDVYMAYKYYNGIIILPDR